MLEMTTCHNIKRLPIRFLIIETVSTITKDFKQALKRPSFQCHREALARILGQIFFKYSLPFSNTIPDCHNEIYKGNLDVSSDYSFEYLFTHLSYIHPLVRVLLLSGFVRVCVRVT